MRRENANPARRGFGEGLRIAASTLTPLQQDVYAAIKKRRAELRERGAGRNEWLQAIQEINEAYYLRQAAVREQVDAQIAEAERTWKRNRPDSATQLLELQRMQLRYSGMDADALRNEIETYVQSPAGWDPDRLLALESAAAAKGHDNLSTLRQAMTDNDAMRPWITPELRVLRGLYDCRFGETKLGDGPFGPETVSLADLFDTSEVTSDMETTT